ncbi:50S ribosomal protein L18e [Candidatus Undinarchaeota archaeon]
MKPTGPTNPVTQKLVAELAQLGKDSKVKLWADLSKRISKPRRNRASVNLSKLDRFFNKDETIVVPGKVLGSGQLKNKVNVAAVEFSESAKQKIAAAGGKSMSISELAEVKKDGKKIRIIK